MSDEVVLIIRDDDETWTTSIIVAEEDLILIRELYPIIGWGKKIELQSIGGYAQVHNDKVNIVYRDGSSQRMVSASLVYAKEMIELAINKYHSARRSDEAWEKIWEWAGERSEEPRWLQLSSDEQIKAKLLMFFGEHIALELRTGEIRIASISNDGAMPPIGSDVLVRDERTKGTLIFRSSG